MKRLLSIALFFFVAGCSSVKDIASLSPNSNVNIIPLKANKIIVETNQDATVNFNFCMKSLLNDGYEITTKDRETGYILAEKKGQYDTYIKLNIMLDAETIKIIPMWKPGTSSMFMASAMSGIGGVNAGWEPALWMNNATKLSVAFIEADKVAHLFNGKITYQTPEKTPLEKAFDSVNDPIYK